MLLAAGQAHAPLSNYCVVSLRQGGYKFIGLGYYRSLAYHFAVSLAVAPGHIFRNRRTEQLTFLQGYGYFVPETAQPVFTNVHAVNQYGAFRHIIEAGDQVDEGGLATAGRAHDSHGLSGRNGEADVLQYIFIAARVGKGNVTEFDFTLRRCIY